jgi:subtilisin family serine protease
VLRAFRGEVAPGPANSQEVGIQFMYRVGRILVRDEYLDQVLRIDGVSVERSLIRGVTLMNVAGFGGSALEAVAYVNGLYGSGVSAPDHVVSIAPGEAGWCPATEPDEVPPWATPDPVITADHAAGEGVRVAVVDTGLDPTAPGMHPWMTGVYGEPDPAVKPGVIGPYGGHGTFVAGVVRAMAPRAEVVVRSAFPTAGAVTESDLVLALDRVLDEDWPDVISMSAGTRTFDPTGLLSLNVFYETRLRHHKGVVFVAAAGNDGDRKPFWPAAAPWTVSVGALAENWRSRAYFSNFGGWVDMYAPGENLVNCFPVGTYTYHYPPLPRPDGHFQGMSRWSGTSFATPVVAGLVAARMSHTGENGRDAAAALLASARTNALPGVGAVLLP